MRTMMIFILILTFLHALPDYGFANEGEHLVKIVALSRHGVRAPTQSAKLLEMWSQKPWPVWPVEKGELTPRGARLASLMWEDLGGKFKKSGFLPKNACPEQKDIFIRADVDERTRATAAAILDGLAPECKLGYAVQQNTKIDPLFHPVKAGLYRYDAIRVATDILERTHGGLERLQDEFSGPLNLLGRIAGPPASSMCARFALMPECQLSDLPNAISISPDGTSVRLVGSLGVASSLAEIFLLEYGEWPDTPSGWGEVDAKVLSQTLPVHSRIFDVVNRADVVAWANGASLLSEMTAALFGEHEDKRANEAKLVIFVGHDTNIANVGSLLDFFWQANGYPPNGIPPAGALFLELWNINGAHTVKARFYAQPPGALHMPFQTADSPQLYAPKEAMVYDGKEHTSVSMGAARFREKVNARILGAPLASIKSPPFAYGPPSVKATN